MIRLLFMKIHEEGYRVIPYAALVILLIDMALFFLLGRSAAMGVAAGLSLLLLAAVCWFFRDPGVRKAGAGGELFSVADGQVVAIEPVVEGEYFGDKRLQVSVFMSVLNVHINHVPIAGEIVYQKHHPGRFFPARHAKSSDFNERCSSVIRTPGGGEVLVRQVAGILARRVVTYPRQGDKVSWSDQLGFIRFGSRVDLFLPPDTIPEVRLGQKVKGGVTLIGKM